MVLHNSSARAPLIRVSWPPTDTPIRHASRFNFSHLPPFLALTISLLSRQEDHHSILRLNKGASFETEGILRFTDSSLTVAVNYIAQPDSIDRDSKWAQRPRYENRSFKAPPQFSMFAPPFTTRETFGERLGKSLLYLSAGDELHWPSSMFSLDGTELTLSVDGSLLFKKHPVAAVDAYGEPVYTPLMTLVAADAVKSMSVIEKGQRGAGKAGGVEFSGRNGRLKVPGGAGGDGGSGAMLTVTDMGDVVSLCRGLCRSFPNVAVYINPSRNSLLSTPFLTMVTQPLSVVCPEFDLNNPCSILFTLRLIHR